MDDFLFQLQELIARNKIQQAIHSLLESFQKCESKNPAAKSETRDLRNQVVLLSARYTETTEKINKGIISPIHADTSKNQLLSAFLNVINSLSDYKEFSKHFASGQHKSLELEVNELLNSLIDKNLIFRENNRQNK